MRQKCIRILDKNIAREVERLERYTRTALFTQVMELKESNQISGIRCDVDEYVGVAVEVDEESIGYLSTQVFTITAFFRYAK